MMLDMKRTFDEVVEAHATPEKAAQIYWATRSTKRCRARSPARRSTWRWRSSASCKPRRLKSGRWDLIVVDTPPARSALDFLDAPERLSSFLDGRLIRVLLAPARGPGAAADRRHVDRDRARSARCSAARCCATCRRSWRPSTRCSAVSGRGPSRPTRFSRTRQTAFLVVASPDAGRPARGGVLRRAAGCGVHAACRAGAQPAHRRTPERHLDPGCARRCRAARGRRPADRRAAPATRRAARAGSSANARCGGGSRPRTPRWPPRPCRPSPPTYTTSTRCGRSRRR